MSARPRVVDRLDLESAMPLIPFGPAEPADDTVQRTGIVASGRHGRGAETTIGGGIGGDGHVGRKRQRKEDRKSKVQHCLSYQIRLLAQRGDRNSRLSTNRGSCQT